MSEAAMWKALRPVMKGMHPVRIESSTGAGIPDVNCIYGWIELKYVSRWPPRKGPLRLPHFTSDQRSWLCERTAAGGKAWVLLKVGTSDWLLFGAVAASAELGQATQDRLLEICQASWNRKPKTKELEYCLQK